jgi:hypothetical protein
MCGEIEAVVNAANASCESCGRSGDLRSDLERWRVLCSEHYEVFRRGAYWWDVFAELSPRMLPDHPEVFGEPAPSP